MRIYYLLIFAIFIIVTLAKGQQTTLFYGSTIDSVTKLPITGVEIRLSNKENVYNAISDRNGSYSIKVAPGKYRLNAVYLLKDVFNTEEIIVKANEKMRFNISFNIKYERKLINFDVPAKNSDIKRDFTIEEISRSSRNYPEEMRLPKDSDDGVLLRTGSSFVGGTTIAIESMAMPSTDAARSSSFDDPLIPEHRSTARRSVDGISGDIDSRTVSQNAEAGKLTSGELNDFRKWEMWNDFAENELKEHSDFWQIKPGRRFTVQVLNKMQLPLVDCIVELLSGNSIIWSSKTDNTGKAELWADLFFEANAFNDKLHIIVKQGRMSKTIKDPMEFKDGINTIQFDAECKNPKNVDIVFAVDATGSMGDEINYLKAEVTDIISKIEDKFPSVNFRTGSVFYCDVNDEYLIKKLDLSSEINATSHFINQQNASGGGDYEEAVEAALLCVVNEISWSQDAVARICFLILDAPPHNKPEVKEKIREIIARASMQGIRIIPVVCSGIDKKTEYLMRSLALISNGSYVFLTDDSGIGDPHIKPTTDKYDTELLNDLFIRLIGQFTLVPECGDDLFYSRENINENIFNKDENKMDKSNDGWKSPIRCYPNPTKGELTIEILSDLDEVFLVDVAGKILQKYNRPYKGVEAFNLSSYPTGIYFIKFVKDGKWGVEKVILIR